MIEREFATILEAIEFLGQYNVVVDTGTVGAYKGEDGRERIGIGLYTEEFEKLLQYPEILMDGEVLREVGIRYVTIHGTNLSVKDMGLTREQHEKLLRKIQD